MCADRFLPTRSCYGCVTSLRAGTSCRLMSKLPAYGKACAPSASALGRWTSRLQRLPSCMTHSCSLPIFEISSRFPIFVSPIGSIESLRGGDDDYTGLAEACNCRGDAMSLPGLAPNNACTPLRCYRTPNTVSLHVLTALSCCASCRLLCVTYAMIARQGRSRCCLSIRLGQHGPHTLRIAASHDKSACASMLRPRPARDYGGEHPCRVS